MFQPLSRLDFWVNHDEDNSKQAISILDYAFIERIRRHKQTVLVLTGDPGEAKSSISQALTEKLLAYKGIDYAPFVNDVTVYTPLEFPEKENKLLYDKRLKDISIMIIDEARLVVKAKNWHEFLNQAIADVFALQRRVKQLFLIIVTQDLDDVDKDVRRLITFWGECYRPLHGPAELHLSKFYKDTSKPAKIELKKRALRGMVVYPDGRQKLDFPSQFIFKMPSKQVWETYDKENYKAKGAIIKKRLAALVEKLTKQYGQEQKSRSSVLLKHFMKPEKYQELMFHFKITQKGKYKLKDGAAEVLGLTKEDIPEFIESARNGFLKLQNKAVVKSE